jgi:ribonucleoside-diphosphate reductase alpha chain
MAKKVRKKVLSGSTTEVTTGCGHLYVTVNKDGEEPIEVFATLGKAGDCEKCQNEAITRLVTLGLRYEIPLFEIHKQLNGLRCPKPAFGGGKDGNVLSCPDAISRVLKTYIPKEEEDVKVDGT